LEEILSHPAVQAGVAPFLVALIAAAVLCRTRLLGLAIVAAFAVVVALTVGYSFESLTAIRKLMLIGLATGALVLALEVKPIALTSRLRVVLAGAGAVAAVWMIWRILQQQEIQKAALYGAGAASYMALLVKSSLRAATEPLRASASTLMLGLGVGGLGLLGASALIAQLGIAVGAGAGAVLLIQMLGPWRRSVSMTLRHLTTLI
jgi:hypothetical protein